MANHRLGAVVLALAIALCAAGAARADGDPASDVLYTDPVFFPYDTTISKSAQQALVKTLSSSEKAGYPIRVALIAQPSYLGAVTSLWKKPRQYARFLSLELSFVYKGPLLIVMPSGIGFDRYKQGVEAEYEVLAGVRVAGGRDGLAQTADRAVTVLAARAGHTITPGSASSGSSGAAGWVAGVIAFALIVAAAGGLVFLRRRRPPRQGR